MVSAGYPDAEIARALDVRQSSVGPHRHRFLRESSKLKCNQRSAHKNGPPRERPTTVQTNDIKRPPATGLRHDEVAIASSRTFLRGPAGAAHPTTRWLAILDPEHPAPGPTHDAASVSTQRSGIRPAARAAGLRHLHVAGVLCPALPARSARRLDDAWLHRPGPLQAARAAQPWYCRHLFAHLLP
jgi:hypothetical protein